MDITLKHAESALTLIKDYLTLFSKEGEHFFYKEIDDVTLSVGIYDIELRMKDISRRYYNTYSKDDKNTLRKVFLNILKNIEKNIT